MSAPRETAAEAVWSWRQSQPRGIGGQMNFPVTPQDRAVARKVLASLAQHRDDIARVLTYHRLTGAWDTTACGCGHEYDGPTGPRDLDAHKADAVLAYLAGETG